MNAFDKASPSLASRLYPVLLERSLSSRKILKSSFRPQGYSPEEIREWLEKTFTELRIRPTQWAKAAGLAPSTLNRFIASTSEHANLSSSTIKSLQRGLERLVSDENLFELTQRGGVFAIDKRLHIMMRVETIGSVAAGILLNDTQIKEIEQIELTVPVSYFDFTGSQFYGFYVKSKAYSPIYNQGDILICIPVASIPSDPELGERYIVHTLDERGLGGIEVSIRAFAQDPEHRYWLLPVGDDTRHTAGNFLGYLPGPPVEDGVRTVATFLIVGRYGTDTAVVKLRAQRESEENGSVSSQSE